jgi:hypothetical protein
MSGLEAGQRHSSDPPAPVCGRCHESPQGGWLRKERLKEPWLRIKEIPNCSRAMTANAITSAGHANGVNPPREAGTASLLATP